MTNLMIASCIPNNLTLEFIEFITFISADNEERNMIENLYYYDENDERSESVSIDELIDLVRKGMISPNTRLETDDGPAGRAGEISGLFRDAPGSMLS